MTQQAFFAASVGARRDAFQREASSARLVRRSLKAARRSARGAGQSTFTSHRSELTVACGR